MDKNIKYWIQVNRGFSGPFSDKRTAQDETRKIIATNLNVHQLALWTGSNDTPLKIDYPIR